MQKEKCGGDFSHNKELSTTMRAFAHVRKADATTAPAPVVVGLPTTRVRASSSSS